MVIDGTYIVSGRYAVHVEFDEFLARNEYDQLCEDMGHIGAAVIPHDSGCSTNGNLQVLKIYEGTIDDLNLAQWDLENSEKDSDEWIEAREAVENFQKELKDYLTLEWNNHTIIVDRSVYKKYCGNSVDEASAESLLSWYVAFANNDCVHMAIIPLNGDGLGNWEDRITNLDYCELDEMGGTLIPVPEICLRDREVIKILNDSGYAVKDDAQFLKVEE